MNDIMTSIMKSARDKADLQQTPLDLRWNNYTRHTCDSFIVQEDMRSEPDCTPDDDMIQQTINVRQQSNNGSMSSPTSSDESSAMDLSSDVPKETQSYKPLQSLFSIATILKGSGCGDVDTPAQVSSPYNNGYLQYQRHIYNWQSKTMGNQPVSTLSPIRGVSMLNTKYVYWCHVCNCFIENVKDTDHHQLVHRLQGSTCNLKRSVFSHHGYVTPHELIDNERFKCGLCNKVILGCFFSKHQRLHDGHFCSVCNQEFSTNSRLVDHMNVHSGIKHFECKICDRKFAKRSSLTQHLRYHRDNKSYVCRFCHKCFNSKYACAVHERLHTGDNPFKCAYPDCDRAYPQKIQLKLHINSHHR